MSTVLILSWIRWIFTCAICVVALVIKILSNHEKDLKEISKLILLDARQYYNVYLQKNKKQQSILVKILLGLCLIGIILNVILLFL